MKLAIEARRIEKNLVTVNRRELPLGIAAKRAKRGERVEDKDRGKGGRVGSLDGARYTHASRERERGREREREH